MPEVASLVRIYKALITIALLIASGPAVGFAAELPHGAHGSSFMPVSVPEPTTFGVVGVGLILIGAARWRGRSRKG